MDVCPIKDVYAFVLDRSTYFGSLPTLDGWCRGSSDNLNNRGSEDGSLFLFTHEGADLVCRMSAIRSVTALKISRYVCSACKMLYGSLEATDSRQIRSHSRAGRLFTSEFLIGLNAEPTVCEHCRMVFRLDQVGAEMFYCATDDQRLNFTW